MVWRDLTTDDLLREIEKRGGKATRTHLFNALAGRARPNGDIRSLVPEILGIPIEACFDPELLEADYTSPRGRRGRLQ